MILVQRSLGVKAVRVQFVFNLPRTESSGRWRHVSKNAGKSGRWVEEILSCGISSRLFGQRAAESVTYLSQATPLILGVLVDDVLWFTLDLPREADNSTN